MFALHTVLLPGMPLTLRVFEPRYLALLDEVAPDGPFVVAAIRHGREVGGPAEVFRVGVTVRIRSGEPDDDGSQRLQVEAIDRVMLVERTSADPYPRWRVEPYPDEGGAGTDDLETAVRALRRYLWAIGEGEARPVFPRSPVAASWAIAAAVPGLPPVRQGLLELPGAGERLRRSGRCLELEARLVRMLGANVGGADPAVSPN